MAQFNPMSEKEAKNAGLLSPGPGEFEIIKAEDKVSQNNNDYLNLFVKMWDKDGREGTAWDIIMYTGGMSYRMRHLCYSCGMGAMYESGSVDPAQLVGRRGSCTISHKADDRSGRDKNAVKDYLVNDKMKEAPRYQNAKAANAAPPQQPRGASQELAPAGTFKEEEIPF